VLAWTALLLLLAGGHLRSREASLTRGVTYGSPPPVEHPFSLWGVNATLEQYDDASLAAAVDRIASGGFHWVRQTFAWAEIEPTPGQFRWGQWDRIVSAAQARGLELIAVLDTTPPWARDGEGPLAPPASEADFGRFARAVAARYGEWINCYQIWDEPNLSSHWGGCYVDPTAYARLLRAGALQIRAVDPQAFILTAGLAPTWEQGPLNLDEVAFLQGLYEAGADGSFDVLAAKPYGFWSGPEDRRVSPEVLNFSRLVRLRETMEAYGDGDKPIWAVEWGWNALPADWRGHPSPWGTDGERKQIQRLRAAAERARLEWPWLGVMVWAEYQPALPPEDPRWGYALLDPEGQPRPFYYALQQIATAKKVAYPGCYPADDPTGDYRGDWRLAAGRADVGRSGDTLTITFHGTALALRVQRGNYWAWLEVSVDGGPANALPRDEEGHSYLVLYDPLWREVTVPLAQGLRDGRHQVHIVANGGWGQWAIAGWVVNRERPQGMQYMAIAMCATGLALLGWVAWRTKGMALGLWATRHSRHLTLPFAVFSVIWLSLPLGRDVMLACAAAWGLLAAWQPLWGLGALVFALPFYMISHPLPDFPVASLDLLGAVAMVGLAGHWVDRLRASKRRLPGQGRGLTSQALGPRRRLLTLWEDMRKEQARGQAELTSCGSTSRWLAGGLVVLALASTLAAEETTLAWGAFWRMMALPALCYLLVRTLPRERRVMWKVIDVWTLSSVAAAGMGLYQLMVGQTVLAEGVQRVAGPYSSPNHLALFLERVVPVLMAVGLTGRHHWRRWGYGLALLPILAALYLTYSRAAWLLALPASLVFLGLASRGRWRRWIWLAVLLAMGAMIPWRGTERLDSLFDLGQGTGALRLQAWRATLEMIAEHPLLGIGPGNFQLAYPHYMRPTAWVDPLFYHSHNVLLDFAAFLGLGGLGLFIGLLASLFRTGARLLRALPEGDDRALLVGLMAGVVGCLAHGLVDTGYFLPDLACLWALGLGVVEWLAGDAGLGE